MATSTVGEATPLVSNQGTPTSADNNRQSDKKQLVIHLILASILLESAAFYALDSNLPKSLKLNDTSDYSWTLIASFRGINLIAIIIFSIISDARLDRARTIIIGFPLYIIGFTFYTLITKETIHICHIENTDHKNLTLIGNKTCVFLVPTTLILTAVGAGAVRSSLIAFGADQIQDSIVTSRYFDKFVVAVNISSILNTLVTILIQDYFKDFSVMYVFGTVMLVLSALVFLIGWRYYTHVKPYDSVVMNCLPVMINAFRSWCQYKKNKDQIKRKDTISSASNSLSTSNSVTIDQGPSTFLDFAKLVHHGKFQDWLVDDVKLFRNAIIVLILLFPYRLIFDQLNTTFVSQAKHMAYEEKTNTVSLLMLSEPITVIIAVFVLNLFVYKHLPAWNRSMKIATKFVISMVFAVITMLIAGGIEILRQHECPGNQTNSELSIYVQLPQDITMSITRLCGLLATFEFAYFVAPRSAQSLFMSIHYISKGVTSFIIDVYTELLSQHKIDLNFACLIKEQYNWHYFTYFFIFAGVQFVFMIIFILCQKKYQLIKLNRQKMERNQVFRLSRIPSTN